MKPLTSFLNFLTETAYQAGRSTLGYFRTNIYPEYKSDNSPVTLADRTAEQFIRLQIEKKYPGSAIIGEEYGNQEEPGASMKFIIDPIDGTKAFMRGIPLYGVLIGLELEGEVRVGACYFPALDEMLAAADGEGCWWNGRRAQVSSIHNLNQAYLLTTDWGKIVRHNHDEAIPRLANAAFHRAGWSDAYAFAAVATGRAEIAIEPKMEVWDCAPFPPIFREAGGFFGNWQGKETIYGGEALACNHLLLPQCIQLLNFNGENQVN